MCDAPVEWGKGEYLTERKQPLAEWFRSSNLHMKLRIVAVSDADLFGTPNPMIAIHHLRKRTVVHVPLGEALAAGMPEYCIPPQFRVRREHSHGCCGCYDPIACSDLECFGDSGRSDQLCARCAAQDELQEAERDLRHEQTRQPSLWEAPEDVNKRLAACRRAVTRATRKLERITQP